MGAAVAGTTVAFAGGSTEGAPSAAVDLFDGATGTWSTAALSVGRYEPVTAVVGDVLLVAGGTDRTGTASDAVDMYDAASGTWTAARLSRPLVPVAWWNDGFTPAKVQVTVVGTQALFLHDDQVDIFDATSRSWSNHALSERRTRTAVVVIDETVLIAGGEHPDGAVSAAIDRYDTRTGIWSTATLSAPRSRMVAVAVGGIAVLGPGNDRHSPVAVADLYDLQSDSWHVSRLAGTATFDAAYGYRAVAVGGYAIVVGGTGVSLFDSSTRTWQAGPADGHYFQWLYAVDGKALLIPQGASGTARGPSVPVFDSTTGSWSKTTFGGSPDRFFGEGRGIGAAVVMGSRLILAGGIANSRLNQIGVDMVDSYDAATDTWATGKLTRASVGVAVISTGQRVVFASGSAVDLYDASTDTWSSYVPGPILTAPPALASAGRYVLVAGGGLQRLRDGGHDAPPPRPGVIDTVHILDTSTGTWTQTQLQQARRSVTGVTVGTMALFIGGLDRDHGVSDVVDIYDTVSDSWIVTHHPQAFQSFRQVALDDARVAILPTPESDTLTTHLAVLDGKTSSWSAIPLARPRRDAVLAGVGSIAIVAGGVAPAYSSFADDVDLYDATSGRQWTAHLSTPRRNLLTVTIGSRVLFAGGIARDARGSERVVGIDDVDVYDAATNTWTITTMPTGRAEFPGARPAAVGCTALFAGGARGSTTVDRFDGTTDRWSTHELAEPLATVPIVIGNLVLFVKGDTPSRQQLTTVNVYDSATDQWSTTTRPLDRIVRPAAVGDRWLVLTAAGTSTKDDSHVEIFDIKTRTWRLETLPRMMAGDASIEVSAAGSGSHVLFGGGLMPMPIADYPDHREVTDQVADLDLESNSWSVTNLMRPRGSPTTVAVGTRIMFAGGRAGPSGYIPSGLVDNFDLATVLVDVPGAPH